ncbi:carbohydrate ABC transporter permease [bacterium]|nr:carbohydrate ABC transporter permease [bacterium]
MNARQITERAVILFLLLLLFVAAVMPFVWTLTTSVKTVEAINTFPPEWIPREVTWLHYDELFDRMAFGRMFFNSVLVTLAVTFVSLFMNAMGGYAFAKFDFPLRGPMFALMIITLMVPAQVTLIPVFLLLKSLGLLNNYLGLIVPGAASVFGIFLMRQFMISVPDAYIESARIDGCGEFRIFAQIVLPLCRPVIAALAIFTFTAVWSDFMMPLIVMQKESMYTLPVALANLSGQHNAEWGLLMAGAAVTILPIAIVFLVLQRRFIEGVTMTGLKG